LNRTEAVSLLKEINTLFEETTVTAVELIEPKTSDSNIAGCQIKIKAFLDLDIIKQIRDISADKGLAVEVNEGEVLISKPKMGFMR
jgi:hypothetical protein